MLLGYYQAGLLLMSAPGALRAEAISVRPALLGTRTAAGLVAAEVPLLVAEAGRGLEGGPTTGASKPPGRVTDRLSALSTNMTGEPRRRLWRDGPRRAQPPVAPSGGPLEHIREQLALLDRVIEGVVGVRHLGEQ